MKTHLPRARPLGRHPRSSTLRERQKMNGIVQGPDTHTGSVRVGDSTPWGFVDVATERALGITVVSTPRHGGVKISEARRATMPPAIGNVETFAGGNWYEEDEDAGVVCLAFPEVFGDQAVYFAHDMMIHRHFHRDTRFPSRWQNLNEDFTGEERLLVDEIAAHYLNDHWGWWLRASGWTSGQGWTFYYQQLGTGAQRVRDLTSDEFIRDKTPSKQLPGKEATTIEV